MKHVVMALLSAVMVLASDATGTWKGQFTPSDREAGPALLILKQDGTALTGTAGPNEEEQRPIQNGKVEEGKLIFELPAGELVMKFHLTLDGDEIKGDITRERDGNIQTAKLHVKRQ